MPLQHYMECSVVHGTGKQDGCHGYTPTVVEENNGTQPGHQSASLAFFMFVNLFMDFCTSMMSGAMVSLKLLTSTVRFDTSIHYCNSFAVFSKITRASWWMPDCKSASFFFSEPKFSGL